MDNPVGIESRMRKSASILHASRLFAFRGAEQLLLPSNEQEEKISSSVQNYGDLTVHP